MELVLDIDDSTIKGAFFQENAGRSFFAIPYHMQGLKEKLQNQPVRQALISTSSPSIEKEVVALFKSLSYPYQVLDYSKVKFILNAEEPKNIRHDQIANIYGALFHFPQNDCIVVSVEKIVSFDLIGKEGCYLGGALYPGIKMAINSLVEQKLPNDINFSPTSPLGKTPAAQVQSGIYWGLLGAIERIVSELRQVAPSTPSSTQVIATGEATRFPEGAFSDEKFLKELSDLVDLIDPQLALIGLYEILKELQYGKS